MTAPAIVAVGEVLWDLLPSGPQMGGAPANFACHARALGADARLVSRVGDDEMGRRLLARLRELGVSTEHVGVDPVHPTGTVTVRVGAGGQPAYSITEGVAWDFIDASPEAVAGAGAVCFGTLAQRGERSRGAIRALVAAAPPDALRVCDVNLRPPFTSREVLVESLALANVVKLNDDELPVIVGLLELGGEALPALRERFALRLVILTRGARGSLLFDGRRRADHPGVRARVKDTVGAGDAFTAAAVMGLLAGWDLDRVGAVANEVAAHVCAQEGATPPMPERLVACFRD
jgi:fructokinase